jgi:hypothetical protein
MNAAEVLAVVGIWVAALGLSVGGGAWLVPWILRRTEEPAIHAQAVAVLRGGTWIGLLERLAITGSLLAGYPEAVAVVVAVKGLGRYPELREHPVGSERFVVGTLASMIWAAAVGALAAFGVEAVAGVSR